jgi:hypothetical protein
MADSTDDKEVLQREWIEKYGRYGVIVDAEAPSRPDPNEPLHVTLHRIERKLDRLLRLER